MDAVFATCSGLMPNVEKAPPPPRLARPPEQPVQDGGRKKTTKQASRLIGRVHVRTPGKVEDAPCPGAPSASAHNTSASEGSTKPLTSRPNE